MPVYEVNAMWIAGLGDQNRYEPQRTNQFRLELSPPGSNRSEEILCRAVRVLGFPEMDITSIPVEFVNEIRHIAGRHVQKPIEITLLDFIGAQSSERILWDWITKVYNPKTGEMGYASEYTVPEASLVKFDPHGNNGRVWTLINVWPCKWKTGDGDMSKAEKMLMTVSLSCDKFWLDTARSVLTET